MESFCFTLRTFTVESRHRDVFVRFFVTSANLLAYYGRGDEHILAHQSYSLIRHVCDAFLYKFFHASLTSVAMSCMSGQRRSQFAVGSSGLCPGTVMNDYIASLGQC